MSKAVFNTHTSATASLLLMLLAAGCASMSVNNVNPTSASSNELRQIAGSQSAVSSLSLIARDFAHMFPQIPELQPEQIILSVLPAADGNADFAEALRKALFQKGYAVRIGGGNFSSTDLTYQIRESGPLESGLSENAPEQAVKLYQLSVGDISLRRRYSEGPAGQVQPFSAMEGRGLDPTAMTVDESIFNISDNNPIVDNTTQALPQAMSATVQSSLTADQPTVFAEQLANPSEGAIAATNSADVSLAVAAESEDVAELPVIGEATVNTTPGTDPNQQMLPELTDPLPGTQLSGADVTFMWDDNGVELEQWLLRVGLSVGTAEFAEVHLTNPATMEYKVSGLPTNGEPVFVDLSFRNDGVWTAQNFEYTAFENGVVNPDNVVLNDDDVTGVAGGQPGNGIAIIDAVVLEEDSLSALSGIRISDNVVSDDALPPNAAEPVRSSPLPLSETANFRDLEHSNYLDLFRQTVVVDILVIDFADNAYTLLPDAIARLKKMAANVVGSDDLISVIGTSHGRLPYPEVQEELARDRAIAVRNSLLAMGIELDNIYLEASWSDNYYDVVLPRQAVVIEVKRWAASGVSN